MRTSKFFSSPGNGLVVGIVVGAFVVLAMTLGGFGTGDEVEPIEAQAPEQQAAAQDAFVAAWERMTQTTWLVQSTFTRTLANGQTFTSSGTSAQIPPNSVTDSNGAVTATIDGRNIVCAQPIEGVDGTCEDRGEAELFAVRREQQIEAVRAAVTASYGVQQRSDDCFLLTASPEAITAGGTTAWGNRATFCFDETSGALDSTRFERDGGVDVTATSKIRDNITMNDLRAVLPGAVPTLPTPTTTEAP